MGKKTETVCARVTPEIARRIEAHQAKLNDRPKGFVVRAALERFFDAVDRGVLPPITDDVTPNNS